MYNISSMDNTDNTQSPITTEAQSTPNNNDNSYQAMADLKERFSQMEKLIQDLNNKLATPQPVQAEPTTSHVVSYPEDNFKGMSDEKFLKLINDTYNKVEEQTQSRNPYSQVPLGGWETIVYGLMKGGHTAEQLKDILPRNLSNI